MSSPAGTPTEITLITLNCWGLLHLSALRKPRLLEIGRQLASHSPKPDIVCLQECWTQADFHAIRTETADILPHAKFYYAGAFGGGLAILSRWPIEESSFTPYRLNGRPTRFYHGDWFVGKGIAQAVVRYGPRKNDLIDVYNTHTHAPYESGPGDTYLCHRISQAWQLSQCLRASTQKRNRLTVALGDFNMLPLSPEHRILTSTGPIRDTWRVLHPDSSLGPHHHPAEQARGRPCPTAAFNLAENGATSDGVYNTWRWSKARQKQLAQEDCPVDGGVDDPKGKRLDYIFASTGQSPHQEDTAVSAPDSGKPSSGWVVGSSAVTMTQRHPTLNVSLSDHFGVVTTLRHHTPGSLRSADGHAELKEANLDNEHSDAQLQYAKTFVPGLPPAFHDEMLDTIQWYTNRQAGGQKWRAYYFYSSLVVWVGCLVAVWFSPRNFVSFVLMLVSSLILASGVVNGLIALLFHSWEWRALKEFEWEVRNSKALASHQHGSDIDSA